MKILKFNILDDFHVEKFFPKYRIKEKVQIIEILLEACRFVLFPPTENFNPTNINQLILVIDKMSRLFFFTENKSYSINFPFSFYDNGNEKSISYKNTFDMDSKMISDMLSIIKDPRFNSESFYDFAETIDEIDENIWGLLRGLLMIEDGYIRKDYDEEAYLIAKDKGKEHTHPLNHLDVFYTSSNMFKIGLKSEVENNHFIDFLDLKTDCAYIK